MDRLPDDILGIIREYLGLLIICGTQSTCINLWENGKPAISMMDLLYKFYSRNAVYAILIGKQDSNLDEKVEYLYQRVFIKHGLEDDAYDTPYAIEQNIEIHSELDPIKVWIPVQLYEYLIMNNFPLGEIRKSRLEEISDQQWRFIYGL